MIINSKVYDVLKWVVMIVLPALSALYASLSMVWGLPYAEQIVATVSAVALFLGALLGVSTHAYNKQEIEPLVNE
jgi:hypothetical protein